MNVGSFLLALIFAMLIPVQSIQNIDSGWTQVGRGIDYREYVVEGPNRVYVARMDRADPTITIESGIARGSLGKGLETVRGMAARTDDSINFWRDLNDPNGMGSWGKRSKVVVAINGSFLESRGSVLPENGFVQSGWYIKRFTDYFGWSGFALTLDGRAFIGDCVYHEADKQVIRFSDDSSSEIDGINLSAPDDPATILYTSQLGGYTPAATDTRKPVEVVVELQEPLMIMPLPDAIYGKIVKVIPEGGATPIEFNQVVVSAGGASAGFLLQKAHEGDDIRFSMQIAHYPECKPELGSPLDDWTRTYTSIGGTRTFLKNGEIIPSESDPNVHPRTAVALNDQYIYFIVVDGREPGWSVGMKLEQLGTFARDYLGATWGIAQDGGGSSTMVINGVVVNNPSDVCRPNIVYLPSVGKDFTSGTTTPPTEQPFPMSHMVPGHCERPVSNSLMMVEVQPEAVSDSFSPGMTLTTTDDINLRLGPGTNYPALARIPEGTTGTVLDNSSGLDGVFAKGYHWWRMDFNGLKGWVAQDYLK